MPNKRASRNAYFFFALEMMPELRRRGFPVSGVKEAIPLCSGDWALLSPEKKEKYSERAKEWRSRHPGPPRPEADGENSNHEELSFNAWDRGEERGQHWSLKKSEGMSILAPPPDQHWSLKKSEGISQHQQGQDVLLRNWVQQSHVQYDLSPPFPNKHDLMGDRRAGNAGAQQKVKDLDKCEIYIINILSHGEMPVVCEQRFVPCEIGCVRYSLQCGVIDSFHKFIDPGVLPLGFRYHCQAGSAATHQIPVSGFELASRDYHNLFRSLCDFVCPAAKRCTSLYCKKNEMHRVRWCLQWLAIKAGMENLFELQDIESLIIRYYQEKLNEEPSKSSVNRLLDVVQWDYANNTRCKWHEDNDMWYCALASCKKITYCISRALASVYDVVLTSAHLPNLLANETKKSETSKTVILDAKRFQKKSDHQFVGENEDLLGAAGGESFQGMRGVTPAPISKARGRGILRLLADSAASC
ncbi:protein maelstrom homolog [Phyllobates terribilis]|uniref:protein maelstrom homolog n=1 Tax=Phyllobates terribilis TaxID=111132 RepID=UPI003CCAEB93